MAQPRGHAHLGEEAFGARRGRRLGVQPLDRDRAAVPQVAREPHRRHPAGADAALHAVGAAERALQALAHRRLERLPERRVERRAGGRRRRHVEEPGRALLRAQQREHLVAQRVVPRARVGDERRALRRRPVERRVEQRVGAPEPRRVVARRAAARAHATASPCSSR